MKTFVLSMFAMLLLVCTGNAQSKSESATLRITTGKTVSDFKFPSFKDLDTKADALISEQARVYQGAIEGGGGACQVSVTVTVTVSVGVASVSVSGTITTSCADVVAATKRLRAYLYQAATSGMN
ncbi:hypothetical protein [Flavobacterium sp.]|uniref:hypothetical protein n=1 Tax=Flavobacterium sp. TaxID=239 RepID=UPI0011FCB662|nr:hypothetical protein [Flavobacterium sp.]RZJ70033.1 MAG: hypothetical protein EOO49_15375 [Flavobacterium sp.]